MKQKLLQIKLTALFVLVLIGYNQCGNPYKMEPSELEYSDNAVSGSLKSEASVEAFEQSVYRITANYCAGCHATQQPQHGHPDSKVAHDSLINTRKVNFSNTANSRIVAKLRDEAHNCWSDCSDNAAQMKAAVDEWALAVEEIEEDIEEGVVDNGSSGGDTGNSGGSTVDSVTAFQGTVYQITRNRCAGCHTAVAPVHAHPDVAQAHNAVVSSGKVNFDNIPRSRLVERLRTDNHQCWGNCESNAREMEAQIQAWLTLISDTGAQQGGSAEGLTTSKSQPVQTEINSGGSLAVNINLAGGNIISPFKYENGYLWAPTGTGDNFSAGAANVGRALYSFNVPTSGTYAFSGEVMAPSDSDNSFFIKVDNGNMFDWHTNESTSFTSQLVTRGSGKASMTFNLTAGAHSLEIKQREDTTRLKSLQLLPASGDGAAVPPGTALLSFDISGILGVGSPVYFKIKIRNYDDYSYQVFDPEIVTESANVRVAGIKLLLNDYYNPQHSTYTLVNTVATPGDSDLSPYSMIVLKDKGAALDRISFKFDQLEVTN